MGLVVVLAGFGVEVGLLEGVLELELLVEEVFDCRQQLLIYCFHFYFFGVNCWAQFGERGGVERAGVEGDQFCG